MLVVVCCYFNRYIFANKVWLVCIKCSILLVVLVVVLVLNYILRIFFSAGYTCVPWNTLVADYSQNV